MKPTNSFVCHCLSLQRDLVIDWIERQASVQIGGEAQRWCIRIGKGHEEDVVWDDPRACSGKPFFRWNVYVPIAIDVDLSLRRGVYKSSILKRRVPSGSRISRSV